MLRVQILSLAFLVFIVGCSGNEQAQANRFHHRRVFRMPRAVLQRKARRDLSEPGLILSQSKETAVQQLSNGTHVMVQTASLPMSAGQRRPVVHWRP